MMKKVIGLTGGIASGKSTVAKFLREAGVCVIDADAVVHELQKKGGALYQVLLDWLGTAILDENGELDRPKLSALIFASEDYLALSAQKQNPIIRQALVQRRDQALLDYDLVVLDIPLLFEQGYETWCDQVWLVAVDEATQVERLMARNGYTAGEAACRIARQMSLAEKLVRADVVIDNNGSKGATFDQVRQALGRLQVEIKGGRPCE